MTKEFLMGTVCSGIGAPEVAAKRLGWRSVFSSEIEAFPNAVREFHFPGVPNLGDMTKFLEWPEKCCCKTEGRMQNEETAEFRRSQPAATKCERCGGIRIDVLVAGTPCQAFSVAGLRKGMADPRGNLTLTFLGIIERYAPRWVLWENVPGVHSSWSDVATHPAGETSQWAVEAALRDLRAAGLDPGADFGIGEFEEADQSNDFDNFLSALEELGYGIATAIYDAQYFGVAQRRRRVFVVGHIGSEWQRAASVLFERESLCGNPAPCRETREGLAPSISVRTRGGGGLGSDAECDGAFLADLTEDNEENKDTIGFNGDVTVKTGIEVTPTMRRDQGGEGFCVAHALKADGFDASEDGMGRGTPIVPEVSPPIRSGENKTGGQRSMGSDVDGCESLVPEVCSSVTSKWAKSSGGPSGGPSGDECQNLVAFDTTQITSKENKSNPKPGDPCHTISKGAHPPAIAFRAVGQDGFDASPISPPVSATDGGGAGVPTIAFPSRMSGTQRAKSEGIGISVGASNPPAIAIQEIGKRQSGTPQNGVGYAEPGAPMFTLQSGAQHRVAQAIETHGSAEPKAASLPPHSIMAVRRLTPRECERLQGFPDDFTAIRFHGKPAADGPRYRALGNSMAVPVIEWILRRMVLVEETLANEKIYEK